jgi:PKD repeat protein
LGQFTWDFGDGLFGSGAITQHAYQNPGSYAVVLTVVDDLGSKATKSSTVTVTGNLPTADFVSSPNNPEAPAIINFNADTSHATVGHSLTRFVWNFGDGSGNVTGTSLMVHTFSIAGTYTVALTVFDDVGQQAITTKQVTVGTGLPDADFVFSPTTPTLPSTGPGVTVTFNASTSTATPGHRIVTYAWDFGGGVGGPISSGSATSSARYSAAGSYTVVLTVTDELGRTATDSKGVIVGAYVAPTR